jgi:valyl-tRNA synthetase
MSSRTHIPTSSRVFNECAAKDVFYPMGWDDNGLPTERRVQNYYGVRCDPSLPYDSNFQPPEKPGKQAISVSRPNFIELCNRLTVEDEKAFEHSVAPSGAVGRLVADLRDDRSSIAARVAGGVSSSAEARRCLSARGADALGHRLPTAVAQAELEDREADRARITAFDSRSMARG